MPKTPAEKMQDYRQRLRDAGMRPVQIWVPDVRSPRFANEARRQSLLVSKADSEHEALDFIEAAANLDEAS